MKKIILSTFIIFSIINTINLKSMMFDQFPIEIYENEIFLINKIIKSIKSAQNLIELYESIKDLKNFGCTSKANYRLFNSLVNKKLKEFDDKSLKDFFIEKKEAIIKKNQKILDDKSKLDKEWNEYLASFPNDAGGRIKKNIAMNIYAHGADRKIIMTEIIP